MLCVYSAITFDVFCDTLDENLVKAEVEEGVDDFIAPWLSFADEINFRTFAGTMFSLFEISILGNWSAVMNSASLKEEYIPLFLFVFRLLMMLCVYPILNSFIIAAYITRKDLQDKHYKLEKEARAARKQKIKEELERKMSMKEHGIELSNMKAQIDDAPSDRLGQYSSGFIDICFRDEVNFSCLSLEINIHDVKSNSMISFWSANGTERYVPKPKKQRPEKKDLSSDTSHHENKCNPKSLQQLRVEFDQLRVEIERRESMITVESSDEDSIS